MRSTKLNSVLVALFVSCALACGGSSPGGNGGGSGGGSGGGTAGGSGGGSGGGSSGTAASFCTSYQQALATISSQCLGGSVVNWETNFFNGASCSEIQAAVDAGRVTFNSSQASACVSAVQNVSCATFSLSSSTPSACESTFSGTVATGDACFSDFDCAGSAMYCDVPAASGCTGTCAHQIAIGQACQQAGCVAGSGCLNSVCTAEPAQPPRVGLGQTCGYIQAQSQTVECNSGLTCDAMTQQCATIVHQSGSCTPGHNLCEFFTYCDSSSNTCQPWPSTIGATCGEVNGQLEYIGCNGGNCHVTTGTAGTCVANTAAICNQE